MQTLKSQIPERFHRNLNHRDSSGHTALMHAVRSGATPDLIEALCSAGADLHMRDKYGRNVLEYAAERCDLDIVKMLIRCGAKLPPNYRWHHLPMETRVFFDFLFGRNGQPEDALLALHLHRHRERYISEYGRRRFSQTLRSAYARCSWIRKEDAMVCLLRKPTAAIRRHPAELHVLDLPYDVLRIILHKI